MKKGKYVSPKEETRKRWKNRIMLEKEYTESCAAWMTERIDKLIDHMQYGCALIAYRKQNGAFRMVRATLIPYKNAFGKTYDATKIASTVAYWDVERQAWRTFQLENFLEWRPVG